MKRTLLALAAATALAFSAPAFAQSAQGVTDSEVLIGSNQDMSGIFAAFGAPAVKAAQMKFDEVNEAGGVNGRKIRFIVEDHAYQMPKAIAGLNKLVNGDRVFAMLLSLGTPMNIAGFQLQDAKNIPNVSPLSAARQMDEPFNTLHFAGTASYYDQIVKGVEYLAETNDRSKVCTLYLPTDFGKEIQQGSMDAAEATEGLDFGTEATAKPDTADFVGSLTKLREAGCDIVTMALGVRQAITAYATARKIGWGPEDVDFMNASAGFHTAIAKVPGGITNGLYAAAGWSDLVARMDDPEVKKFSEAYTKASGEQFPSTGAVLGYSAATTLVNALEAAGPELTTESFIKGMESLDYRDPISDNQVDYGPEERKGADEIIISQVTDGDWKVLKRIEGE